MYSNVYDNYACKCAILKKREKYFFYFALVNLVSNKFDVKSTSFNVQSDI